MLNNFVAPYDSTVVSRLKSSGAIIIGKTNMDEFGMGSATINTYYGPVTNPHNSLHVAGGSSGGSAAAVASGSCFAAIGSDTGGSVRQPASFCGLVGLKPAYGSVSRHGLISYASSLDTPGILARNVDDAFLVLREIDGGDDNDSTSWKDRDVWQESSLESMVNGSGKSNMVDDAVDLKGVTVGIPMEYYLKELPKEILDIWQQSLYDLVDRGAEIRCVSLETTKYAVPSYYIIALAEASSNLARYDGIRYGHRSKSQLNDINVDVTSNAAAKLHQQYQSSRSEGFGAEVQRRLLTGNYVLSAGAHEKFYGSAIKVRDLIRKNFVSAFKEVDCIICPVTTTSAPTLQDAYDSSDPVQSYVQDVMTVPTSLAGLPSISVPRGSDSLNLPVGIQVIGSIDYHGPGGCSRELFRCAHVLGRGVDITK
jgi:aspartyl-tRNA(Asn)/glutamyl-tRNA(Gln) amidotransferase subunit A